MKHLFGVLLVGLRGSMACAESLTRSHVDASFAQRKRRKILGLYISQVCFMIQTF
jgi:hypothetical protein